jgi:hypothetical protein
MPNFTEADAFPAVPVIEQADLVIGGSETSASNRPIDALVDRTRWLRNRVEAIESNTSNLIVGSDVQAWDTDLDALAAQTGTGLLRRTGNGTATTVSTWVDPSISGGRLSLVTADTFPTTDQIDADRLYYIPHSSNLIALRSGSEWRLVPFVESSASLAALPANTNHDVFISLNGASLAFEFQAWTSATAQSVALVRQDGVLCKLGDLTRRYMGTIRTTGAGKTESSRAKRFVWNVSNQIEHVLRRRPVPSSWSAVGTAWRAANGDNDNRVQVVCGVRQNLIDLRLIGRASINGELGIAINSAGAPNIEYGIGLSDSNQTTTVASAYIESPRVGHSFYQMVERSQSGNSIFAGDETALSGIWRC